MNSWSGLLVPVLLVAALPVMAVVVHRIWRTEPEPEQSLAFLDDLTGLSNRRAFMRRGFELTRRTRPGAASLVLLDVDGLKQINDDCGHQAGDELLNQVARQLANVGSTVYRIGGDEFAILIDRSRGESVTALMRMLTPEKHQFAACGHEHAIQFSYGFASRRDGESFSDLFARADARLRQFKYRLYSSGRRQERRLSRHSATVELDRVIAEAEADENRDDNRVISIFSRRRHEPEGSGYRGQAGL